MASNSSKSNQSGLVSLSIKVGSNKIDNDSYPIISVNINKTVNKIPYARIVLYDGSPAEENFPISNSQIFKIGSKIEIQAGYQSKLETVFQGIVVKQAIKANAHATSYLIIDCKDAAYRTTLVPKNISFPNTTDNNMISKILKDYKGQGISSSIQSTTITHEILSQQETTDWDFINIRAEANGQIVLVDDGKITIAQPNVNGAPAFSFAYGVDIYSIDLEMDARDQWQGASGKIWNPTKQQSSIENGREPGEKSFGNTQYSQLTSANAQTNTTVFFHPGVLETNEIQSLATSLLTLNRISKIQGKIGIKGLSNIKPGSTIKIDKGADVFQGTAYVSGVEHKIEAGNWITELTIGLPSQRYLRKYHDIVSLPAGGMLPPIHGLQIGTVKELTGDPKSLNRIFVNLPMVHTESNQGVWCRIASFYASENIGAFFMPEKDDEVVVGFINDDFRSPIIVGSLYSGKKPPPVQQDDNNSVKALMTKSKLELTFNDQNKEIVLQTPGGRIITISDNKETIEITNGSANKIVLGNQGVEITSSENIVLNAQGSISLKAQEDITIQATNAVNLSGMNISANADMKASLVGSTSVEVQSSASTVIKGAIVQIN